MSDICLPLILEILIRRGLWQTGTDFGVSHLCPIVGNSLETAWHFSNRCIFRKKFQIFFFPKRKLKGLFEIVW